ncbi:MAG TPA: response regulator transcription factor [Gaiellaceae bacterium]|jgi:DNA-binding response OmpR family regulator|nr:response regulator transcription factor [Gaiellaceae bacterium]
MAARRILVVEDDEATRYAVSRTLEAEGFSVETAADGEEGLAAVRLDHGFDLVILDWGLPRLSGIDVCRVVRAESPVPIIMLSAKETEVDRVLGLEMGADDYLVKPFSTKELVSRIRAVIRRQALEQHRNHPTLRVGSLALDAARHRVEVEGRDVHLTPTEFRLVSFLGAAPGRVHSREEIMRHLWQSDFVANARTVDVHIRNIRRKIERDPTQPERLVNVRGVGYQLLAELDG